MQRGEGCFHTAARSIMAAGLVGIGCWRFQAVLMQNSRWTIRRTGFFIAMLVLLTTGAAISFAAESQRMMLSGHGKDDPVRWDFICNGGMNADKWSTIGVPSNWELQGFGVYEYGRPVPKDGWSKVQGKYKRTFTPPAGWSDLKIFVVFEGVMTDTQVFINGTSAGPMHQGGYYQFRYDISKLLKFGQENLLEVTVDDESANASINSAERRGDYWNYSGIFRPVYLQADPQQSIDRVAIDAKANGTFSADVYLHSSDPYQASGWSVEAQVMDMSGNPVGAAFSQPRPESNATPVHFTRKFESPRLWNAEQPNLYQVEFRLQTAGGVIHSTRQKFGFRTIEARPGEGLFVNGSRIMLRGTDRHCFWPDSGRCLSEQLSRDDIRLMKDMNMNAVRCSHYPPDIHFLEAADEMGFYVLDELAGWHAKYDDISGHRLVEEMVKRDVNHPSILFWDNGNEGGWNINLDDDFDKWDPQQRRVLHPQQLFRGINNRHYPSYANVVQLCNGNEPFFPTEMLHGNYDGGAGAGLEDYWNVMLKSKVSAGGFIWAYLDEDVKRVDLGGKIDSWTNMAPDGIVGPYREKEGSFYSIKQLWCPIAVTRNDDGSFTIENRYAFIDAKQCSYIFELRNYGKPVASGSGTQVAWSFPAIVADSIPPGKTGKLQMSVPTSKPAAPTDAVALIVKDPDGHELWTYVWPEKQLNAYRDWPASPDSAKINITDAADTITATVKDLSLQFNKKTGQLAAATRSGKTFSFNNGPRLVTGDAQLSGFTQSTDGNDILLNATYSGNMNSVAYRIHPNGWLSIDYAYNLTGQHDFFGVGFDYPEANVKGMRYLGNGPATVYKNRLTGGMLDLWNKPHNNTMVGDPDDLAPGAHFDYPVFKGYYAGIRWVQLETTEGPITALVNQDDLFVQVFAPKNPPIVTQTTKAWVNYPSTGVSFLHAIPAIGAKNVSPTSSGPKGQPPMATGDYKGSISLYFGEIPAN
jgi:hypothetical protein